MNGSNAALTRAAMDYAIERFKAALQSSSRNKPKSSNIEPKGATLYIIHSRTR